MKCPFCGEEYDVPGIPPPGSLGAKRPQPHTCKARQDAIEQREQQFPQPDRLQATVATPSVAQRQGLPSGCLVPIIVIAAALLLLWWGHVESQDPVIQERQRARKARRAQERTLQQQRAAPTYHYNDGKVRCWMEEECGQVTYGRVPQTECVEVERCEEVPQ